MPYLPGMKSILVTGAAKGIGRACAVRLVQRGHRVYAGVRSAAAGEELARELGPSLVPLQLEVTDSAQLQAAAEHIGRAVGAQGLYGLVNNAGVAVAGPLEFLPLDELRRQLEINVVAQLAVTQAMLPLIRKSKGRIVNIGSVSGKSAMPLVGPYAASKHALEALTDALRVELMEWGIQVAIIEPGMIATPIWQTSVAAAEKLAGQMPPEATEYYGRIINGVRERALGGTTKGAPPELVADAVEHALFSDSPKTRYVVGRDARLRLLLQRLPDRWRDRLVANQLKKL